MPELVNQPSAAPSRKVGVGAVIGIPAGVILVYVLNTFTGITEPIPGEAAAAIGSILSFIASYFVKERT